MKTNKTKDIKKSDIDEKRKGSTPIKGAKKLTMKKPMLKKPAKKIAKK